MNGIANTPFTPAMNPAAANPGVARCCAAARATYDKLIARHKSKFDAHHASRKAYRKALPPLDTPANICDFVACVTYGMLNELIYQDDGACFLHAAQVAKSVQPKAAPAPSPLKEAELVAKLLKYQSKM